MVAVRQGGSARCHAGGRDAGESCGDTGASELLPATQGDEAPELKAARMWSGGQQWRLFGRRDSVAVRPEPPSPFALRATEDREGGTTMRKLGLRCRGANKRAIFAEHLNSSRLDGGRESHSGSYSGGQRRTGSPRSGTLWPAAVNSAMMALNRAALHALILFLEYVVRVSVRNTLRFP